MDRTLRTTLNDRGPLAASLILTERFPFLRVFPVRPDQKTPCLVGWQEKASSDRQALCDLWNEARKVLGAITLGGGYPDVGIVTGKLGGVFVVDCDAPEAAYWFETTFGLPGPHVHTSRGGHYYFACPELEADIPRNSASRIFPKVDVRGVGGLVVAPPSSRKSGGRYEWTEHCEREFPYKAPEVLLSLCKPPARTPRVFAPSEYKAEVGESLSRIIENRLLDFQKAREGERNNRLNRTAFFFGAMARGAPAQAGAILDACQELGRRAVAMGLSKREVQNVIVRAFEEGQGRGTFTMPVMHKTPEIPTEPWDALEKPL